jgi:hypothetical protein
MKPIYLRRKSCRTTGTRLVFPRALNATEKTSERSLTRTAALAAAVFTVCFASLWFGTALSPLLFYRNHSSPQSSGRTGSTNGLGELLSGGTTLVYAFAYVFQADPVENTAGVGTDTNILTLAQLWPSNSSGSAGCSILSNYSGLPGNPSWHSLRLRTNADG